MSIHTTTHVFSKAHLFEKSSDEVLWDAAQAKAANQPAFQIEEGRSTEEMSVRLVCEMSGLLLLLQS